MAAPKSRAPIDTRIATTPSRSLKGAFASAIGRHARATWFSDEPLMTALVELARRHRLPVFMVGLALFCYLGMRFEQLLKHSVGDECRDNRECRSHQCLFPPRSTLRGYCTQDCTADSDCPSPLHCGEAAESFGFSGAAPVAPHIGPRDLRFQVHVCRF